MISVRKTGFTIIEVMLFLAISGLLFTGIIFGTGSSINAQRYRDSVDSLQSILQQQFSEVTNVINDNSSVTCNGVGGNRGQSSCEILGKYITYSGGSTLTIQTVIGRKPNNTPPVTDDIAAFSQYTLTLTPNSTSDLEWNTRVRNTSNSAMSFSILMLRSPLSGAVRTFINDTAVIADNSVSSLLNLSYLGTTAKLCVDPNGLSSNKPTEILINAGATNPAAIETVGDADVVRYACR